MKKMYFFIFLLFVCTNYSIANDYRKLICNEILHRLMLVHGNARTIVLAVHTAEIPLVPALYSHKTDTISIESYAYDLCISMGEDSLNALAVLISHEFIHAYQDYSISTKFEREKNADILGLFLAYTAGYKSATIMPRLLDLLYQKYEFPASSQGYPTLEDRKSIAIETEKKATELYMQWEMANYLNAEREFEVAEDLYQQVLKSYKGKEVCNNIAVNYIQTALKYYKREDMPYQFPLEMDMNSNLRSFNETDSLMIINKLEKATNCLKQVENIASDYIPFYINKGVIAILTKEYNDAKNLVQKAVSLSKLQKNIKGEEDAYKIMAISYAEEGNHTKADSIWDTLRKRENVMENPFPSKAPPLQVIDKIIMEKYLPLQQAKDIPITHEKDTLGLFYHQKNPNSELYFYKKKYTDENNKKFLKSYLIQVIDNSILIENYKKNEVLDTDYIGRLYGKPSWIQDTNIGVLWVYPQVPIIFYINQNKEINKAIFYYNRNL